jgi:hypothetical protein
MLNPSFKDALTVRDGAGCVLLTADSLRRVVASLNLDPLL